MRFELLPPSHTLVHFMDRTYGRGMTTTSGGNLSVLDTEGELWITPGGIDKGTLRPEDIVRIDRDGAAHGVHNPSVELPFHRCIYEVRSEVRAVLHAHSPALVTFSLMGEAPDTSVFPRAAEVCGEVGVAPYALPGSEQLGRNVAEAFARGHNAVLLRNHGITTVAATMPEAFERFETLDFCARLLIHARRIGTPVPLERSQLSTARQPHVPDGWWSDYQPTSEEKELRHQLTRLVRRAYGQSLFTSTEGTFAARLGDGRVLVTPYGVDRHYIEPEDFVAIYGELPQPGSQPSRAWRLITKVFARHPEVHAVVIAHPPYTMAFAVTEARFATPIIPESYVMLRDVPVVPFNTTVSDPDSVAATLCLEHPVVLVRSECVLVCGESLLKAYDRLEVCEFTARSLVAATGVGLAQGLSEGQQEELRTAFF